MAAIGGLLKVISLISATIGIVNFIKANEPDKKGPYDSVVRIAVGLNNKNGGLQDANGWSPMILAFNELGDPCGVSRFDSLGIIPDGSYRDITIHQSIYSPDPFLVVAAEHYMIFATCVTSLRTTGQSADLWT